MKPLFSSSSGPTGEKKFKLYIKVLEELTPLFFAMNHVNYARWMPVHIRDMKSLPDSIREEFHVNYARWMPVHIRDMKSLPDSIREEFLQHSNWVLSKTSHKFSAIPFDQAHEQENKIAKGAGGAVGLTENPTAFRRWMLSGPEMARLLKEFQEEYLAEEKFLCTLQDSPVKDIAKEGEDESTKEQCGTVWPALYRNAEPSE